MAAAKEIMPPMIKQAGTRRKPDIMALSHRSRTVRFLAFRLLAFCLAAFFVAPVQAAQLTQFSTIDALMSGVYDGPFTIGEVRRAGDFGLGTFNALDGEMVLDHGTVYQVRADGSVHRMGDGERTPFAAVARFKPEQVIEVPAGLGLEELERFLDQRLPSANLFYAVRIDGEFRSLKARSVPRQQRPYPPLAEAAKQQAVFDFGPVQGAVLGFCSPPFVTGVNVPGYHLHFLTNDRKAGGHVLDFRIEKATLSWQMLDDFRMRLPTEGDFTGADLARDRQQELNQVERHGR
jgi:alpha-acetolactate decarboxylase